MTATVPRRRNPQRLTAPQRRRARHGRCPALARYLRLAPGRPVRRAVWDGDDMTQSERLEILREIARLEQLVLAVDLSISEITRRRTKYITEGHRHDA